MGRLVQPKIIKPGPVATAQGASEGSPYLDRVLSYIPAEVISGYVALSGVVSGLAESNKVRTGLLLGLFLLALILTPLHLIKVGRPKDGQYSNIVIATIAFVFWAYATGGPFAMLPYYKPALGALAMGVFTWVVGLYQPAVTLPVANQDGGKLATG
jgi:hypothetical protein